MLQILKLEPFLKELDFMIIEVKTTENFCKILRLYSQNALFKY